MTIGQLVIKELQGRAGFDAWWDDLELDVQTEITFALTQLIWAQLMDRVVNP